MDCAARDSFAEEESVLMVARLKSHRKLGCVRTFVRVGICDGFIATKNLLGPQRGFGALARARGSCVGRRF